MSNVNPEHIPVLLEETLDLLNLQSGMNVIDGTLGLGGHSSFILERIGKTGKLMAFDQDLKNLKKAKERLKKHEKQITFVHDNFENLKSNIEKKAFPKPDAILLDLGFSSPHVDNPERGFSFQKEGPLDMRYNQKQELSAYDIVNYYPERKLADLIYEYGEERRSRPIARKIVENRKKKPIENTLELAALVKSSFKPSRHGHHPATKTFQALRIAVNRELEVLENTLQQSVEILEKEGRIAVISYHSLEDRITKHLFKSYAKDCICPKEIPICQCKIEKKLYILTKRPIIPSSIEVEKNPRARSAKLRVAQRL